MGFFDRLVGRRANPTRNWDAFSPPGPDFDLSSMRLGTLGFGDPFESARFLGRPDRFKWTLEGNYELLYAAGGFLIEYDAGVFAYLAFFIGPDAHLPNHKSLKFCRPRVLGGEPDGLRLSQDYDRSKLEQLFGPAESEDSDSLETVLFYTRRGVIMEFELNVSNGQLKRWNLYPK